MLAFSIAQVMTSSESEVGAANAGTPPEGQSILSPTSGNSETVFELQPAAAAVFCAQDSATGGWRWQTFQTSAANDPATLTYDGLLGPVGPEFTQPLWSTPSQEAAINRNTSPDTGQIVPSTAYSFGVYPPDFVPAGDYWIGYACTDPAGTTQAFWSTRITVTADAANGGAGNFTWTLSGDDPGDTTTTTTIVDDGTTTTTEGTTTTTVPGGATTSTAPGVGSTSVTVTPASPTAGGTYSVAFRNCEVGETITFSQPQSTPSSVSLSCQGSSALETGSVAGFRRPAQTATGAATGTFTAPTTPGTYTVTMTGTASEQRTVTFVVAGATTAVGGGSTSGASTGGSPSGSTGTIPSTGSSPTAIIVWGILLLAFGRMAILLGRKPKVRPVGS